MLAHYLPPKDSGERRINFKNACTSIPCFVGLHPRELPHFCVASIATLTVKSITLNATEWTRFHLDAKFGSMGVVFDRI